MALRPKDAGRKQGIIVTDTVSFDQVKGSLGSLLFLWSRIERTARDEVAAMHGGKLPKSAHGLAAVLDAWEARLVEPRNERPLQAALASEVRARLKRPLEIRNGVCHGLFGISAEFNGRPAEISWDLNGKRDRVLWDELQQVLIWLSRAPRAIGILSHAAAEPDDFKAAKRLPDPGWWASEFGITNM